MEQITSCYRRGDGSLHVDLSPEAMTAALADPAGLLWVDIEADGRADGEAILTGVFHFHPLTIDDCYNTIIDPPKVDDYGAYLFAIVQNIAYDDVGDRLFVNELDLYLGNNYVVSVHRSPVVAVAEVRRRAEQGTPVMARGPAFLAHALIDVVVDDYHPVVERIDEQVLAVEVRVLEQPERETLAQVLRLKRNVQRLKRSILPQRDLMNRFSRGEFPHLVPPESLLYYRDIYDHTVRVAETIESVRDLADSALNTYLSSVNNRINEVMKTLAIVTVVFLPLTLISGIYGTNFEDTLPQYSWNPGFVSMIVAMVVLSAALVAWFRWRRWF
jgi:magnesium transporter